MLEKIMHHATWFYVWLTTSKKAKYILITVVVVILAMTLVSCNRSCLKGDYISTFSNLSRSRGSCR